MEQKTSKLEKYFFGIATIAIGIFTNPWILAQFFTDDGQISNPFAAKVLVILAFNLILLLIGIFILRDKIKVSFKGLLVSTFTFLIMLLLLEGVLRGFFYIKKKYTPNAREYTELLGWQTSANQVFSQNHPVFGAVNYSTGKHGFRNFGDINTEKLKVMVLGDSYTQAGQVSDGETYYQYLMNHSDSIELFAYGCGGYGSLQEYMIVDTYIDSIKPDLILWQFCSNDIINNSHTLESQSFMNNNLMTRPYLIDGEIKMLFPKRDQGFTGYLVQSSYLLRLINTRVNLMRAKSDDSIEKHLTDDHPLMVESKNTTKEIFEKLKTRIGNTPVITFSVDELWENVFQEISESHGFNFVKGIPQKVNQAKEKGMVVDGTPLDAHWNNNGHSIAGASILAFLEENCFFQDEQQPTNTLELSYK